MTADQLQAKLILVHAALDYILTGKAESAARAGRAFTALSLPELEKLRRTWEAELSLLVNHGGKYRPMAIQWGPRAPLDQRGRERTY
jgi:hypothetical protein